MTTHITSRRLASLAGTLLIGGAGSLASAETAHAFDVAWSDWDSGTSVLLDAQETADAVADSIYVASSICGHAITRAVQTGIAFPDAARYSCASAVDRCAHDAYARGNALSGARLYADGSHRCLVR